jgi:hypothetical protein
MHSQLVNVDSPIGQYARVSVNPADPGVRRDNSFQTFSRRHGLAVPLASSSLAETAPHPAPKNTARKYAVKIFISQRFPACHEVWDEAGEEGTELAFLMLE